MAIVSDPRRTTIRAATAVIGLAVVWLTVLAFTRSTPLDLTIALLVVLAEVLGVAVMSGPILAILVALAAVVLVNWYLVPPYGTFEVASADNLVALVVFALVAAVAAVLVELGARARASAEESARRTELLGEVVTAVDDDDARTALERVRTGLGLAQVELRGRPDGGGERALVSSGAATIDPVTVDVTLPDGYRLVGRGPEVFAPDPDFLASLGAAAVRAFESERLEEESRRAEELAAVDRARTALLASVGHDLRTPLSALRVSVDTLSASDSALTADDRRTLVATMSSATGRLDDLITNLLDMSRLQAGVLLAATVPTDVADAIDGALIAAPDPRVRVDLPETLPPVSGDPALLERVIANLLSNALRYSPTDRPVSVRVDVGATHVVLHVVDSGPGIGPEDAAQVFTAFHRVGAQADGGTGLGLAIVRGFAEAMDMQVALGDAPTGGLDAALTMRRWDAVPR